MRPPLLKKQEIDVLKAKEKAQAVAEGLKLTRRIDGLRELAVETEENYQKFTSATLKTLQSEIDSKILERDTLIDSIRTKKAEWDRLLEPLDINWKRYVQTEKNAIDTLKTEWEQKNALTVLKAEEYKKLNAESIESKEKSDVLIQSNLLERKEIEALKHEATEVLADARNDAHTIILNANLITLNAEKKLEEVLRHEESVHVKEATLHKEKQEVERREFVVLSKELALASPVKQL